ncbi:MAG: hypothetical protein ACI9WS_002896 [Paraglaciecola psychrophila]
MVAEISGLESAVNGYHSAANQTTIATGDLGTGSHFYLAGDIERANRGCKIASIRLNK